MRKILLTSVLIGMTWVIPVRAQQLSPAEQAYTAGTYSGEHAAGRFLQAAPPDATSEEVLQRAINWAERESTACEAAPSLACDMENMGRLPPGTEQDFMRGFRAGFELGATER